jgi:hypothetical protein
MARSPNEGLYNSLYDKDLGMMRKLMNLDEFQCPGNVSHNNSNGNCIGAPNNDLSATKQQFHQYSNGVFNGKFANSPNFPFPFDKQPTTTNGIRHEGLLKPCYEFPSKADGLDDGFGSSPISTGGFKKQQQQQQSALGFTSSGFINQFPHESLFGANNQHSTFAKLNEINNNNGGGIVVKMENGIGGVNDFNTLQMNNKTNELLCPRSSNTLNKTEPNEFRSSSCKGNADNVLRGGDEDEQKPPAMHDESNDGFTQL